MPQPNLDDDRTETLVRLAQQGDRKAFRTLYERFHRKVFRTAVRLLGDPVRAEDVVQEVFVTIYERLNDFNLRSSFSTWMYRITMNACFAVMRKQERRGKYYDADRTMDGLTLASSGATPEASAGQHEVRRYLEEAIRRLSPDLRATFVLRQTEGLSYREIGKVLDVSTGTVASRLARAREQLSETLLDFGIDETYFS